MRQPEHVGAGGLWPCVGVVAGGVVRHQHRNLRHYLIHFADYVRDGALFVEGRDQDHELIRPLAGLSHRAATWRGLMEKRRISRRNCLGVNRRFILRRCFQNAGRSRQHARNGREDTISGNCRRAVARPLEIGCLSAALRARRRHARSSEPSNRMAQAADPARVNFSRQETGDCARHNMPSGPTPCPAECE